MVKIIREILVLPLKLLLLVGKFFPIVDQYTLVKWIWKIGRTVQDGYNFIGIVVNKEGLQAGRDLALEIFKETRSANIIYLITWFETKAKNYERVKSWIELAEDKNCKDSELLLSVKHNISYYVDGYDRDAIIDQMLACKYLPPDQTRDAMVGKVCILMENAEYEEAEKILDHMLSIAETQPERLMKGIICLSRNEDEAAMKHFYKSKGKISDDQFYATISRAHFNLDRDQEGMEWFLKAINAGFEVNEENQLLWEVYNSKEFADYCAARD